MNIKNKYFKAGIALFIILTATIASASVITHFNETRATFQVQQSITVDGNNWDEPVEDDFNIVAGETVTVEHTVVNHYSGDVTLRWTEVQDIDGISVKIQRGNILHYPPTWTGVGFNPFTIHAGETIQFRMVYISNLALAPGEYTYILQLVLA